MQIGTHIKDHRTRLGLSQDDLAMRIYVSRQTISSWETGKTYPDVQSLLLLSEVFDATVDSLIQGDVETMAKTIEQDAKKMNRLSAAMLGLLVLTLAAFIWAGWQYLNGWGWHTVPTGVLGFVLWAGAMAAASSLERIKREHDLVTYQEILAFSEGRPVDRDNPASRKVRALSATRKVVRVVGIALIAAVVGAILGYGGMWLVDGVLGL